MDTEPNFIRNYIESYDFPQSQGKYILEFDRREAMPPDEVSALEGLSCGHTLQLIELAASLYGLETRQNWRVLDLGCGIGTFLVGAIAGSKDLPLEIVGLDNDSRVLNYAENNIVRAEDVSRTAYPKRQISHRLIQEEWSAPDLWQQIGQFDFIFFNPPYLKYEEPVREPGYLNVPQNQMFSANPEAEYSSILEPSFNNLRVGGVLALRGSSRHPHEIPTRHFLDESRFHLEHIGSFQQYSAERAGYIEKFTKLPSDWPANRMSPYGDPRLRVLLSTGKDIGKI